MGNDRFKNDIAANNKKQLESGKVGQLRLSLNNNVTLASIITTLNHCT